MLGLDRKKCVIVDLDGVLWPGVLAETGSPFAWSPEISGPNSYIGLYFGIHEALRALRQRGILLACVSKNDEATVRDTVALSPALPAAPPADARQFRLLAHQLGGQGGQYRVDRRGTGLRARTFMFVDDSPRERERMRQSAAGRRRAGARTCSRCGGMLLTDPRLQPAHLTEEAAARTELVKAQLDRTRLRAELPDEAAFVASLNVVRTVERLTPETAKAGCSNGSPGTCRAHDTVQCDRSQLHRY